MEASYYSDGLLWGPDSSISCFFLSTCNLRHITENLALYHNLCDEEDRIEYKSKSCLEYQIFGLVSTWRWHQIYDLDLVI